MPTPGARVWTAPAEMAHQAARSELSDEHREAFRTLAAASPADRKEGAAAYAAAVEPPPEAISGTLTRPPRTRRRLPRPWPPRWAG